MRELAHTRVRYGYRRVHVLLRREGWSLSKNQMYRLYCEEALQLILDSAHPYAFRRRHYRSYRLGCQEVQRKKRIDIEAKTAPSS
jgi:hypothetical protein